jgi:hypothetical protein
VSNFRVIPRVAPATVPPPVPAMDGIGPIRPPHPRGERPASPGKTPRAADPAAAADPARVADPARAAEVAPVTAPGTRGGPGAPVRGGSGTLPGSHASLPGFDDAEVALILARAAELDALAPGSSLLPALPGDRRLSLSDLESVAIEAGIDPDHVRTAASELALRRTPLPPSLPPAKTWTGLPERVDADRVLPVTLDEAAWGLMVQELREFAGSPGVMSSVGGVWEWHSRTDGQSDTVSLRAEFLPVGGTRLTVSRNTRAAAQTPLILGGSFALMIATLFVLWVLVPPANPGVGVPSLLGFMAAAGAAFTGTAFVAGQRRLAKTEARLGSLMDRMELLALRGGGEGGR